MRRVSAGVIFRELAEERGLSLEEFSRIAEGDLEIDKLIDSTQAEAAKKGNTIIDGQLAASMAGEYSDLNILLTAPVEVRIKRIADRDGTDFEFAKRETIAREGSEKARYFEYYKVDISDLSIYDLILNTGKYDLEGVTEVISKAIEIFFANH